MAETFRDTAVGAVLRYLSGNRLLQFPEERAGFQIPELWQKMLDGDVEAEVLDEHGNAIQPEPSTEKPVEQRSMYDVSHDSNDSGTASYDEENIRHLSSEKPNTTSGGGDDIYADNSPYAAMGRAPTAHSHMGSAAHPVASVQHTRSREQTLPFTQDRLDMDALHDAQRTQSLPVVPRLVRTRTVPAAGAVGGAQGKSAEAAFETAIVVDWYTTDDRANPLNWSVGRRFAVAFIIWVYTFVVYVSSAIYINSQPGVIETFGVSITASSLGLSLFVLGYGTGPLLFSPLSEIPSIGRNPVYVVTMILFVIFSLPTALAYGNLDGGYSSGSFGGLLVLRFLQGFFGSPCLASGGASLGDMFSMMSLPYGLVAWVSAAFTAPALGPLLSGYSVPAKGWQWSLLEILWASAPCAVLMLGFLPETSTPNILLRRAKRLRALTGSSRFQAPSEVAAYNEKMMAGGQATKSKAVAIAVDALIKPIEIAIKDPAVLFVTIYTAIVYGIYYSFFEAFPIVYAESYGMSAGEVGLVFLCILVAAIIGIVIYCTYVALVLNRGIRTTGRFPPNEDRLIPAMYAAFGPTIGLFLFAWTANNAPSIHWIVPTIGITIYGASVFIVLQCVFVYVPLSYPQYAASLFAANDFCRSAFAAGSILFGRPLFINLGIGRGVSVLGGLSTIGIVGMWLLYYYGARLRAMSKFAV